MSRPNIPNFRVAVKETGDRIIWLRKIVASGTDKSYGIQVARMAGLPPGVIARSPEIHHDLEKTDSKRSAVGCHGRALRTRPTFQRFPPRSSTVVNSPRFLTVST